MTQTTSQTHREKFYTKHLRETGIIIMYIKVLLLIVGVCSTYAAESNLGDGECAKDSECDVENGYCDIPTGCEEGQCYCKEGYTRDTDTKCKKMKLFDEACTDASDCYFTSLPMMTCTSDKCACPTDYEKTTDKKGCKKTTPIVKGAACTADYECASGLVCLDVDGTGSVHAKECVKLALKGADCEATDLDPAVSFTYCYAGYTCDAGTSKCVCAAAHSEKDVHYLGVTGKLCVADALVGTYGVAKATTCTATVDPFDIAPTFTAAMKYCAKDLFCAACPGETALVCRAGDGMTDGAAHVFVSAGLLLISTLVAMSM